MANGKGRVVNEEGVHPVRNTGEGAGATVPLPKPEDTRIVSLPAMREGDPSRTQPAMRPAPPEKEPRLPGEPPPGRSR